MKKMHAVRSLVFVLFSSLLLLSSCSHVPTGQPVAPPAVKEVKEVKIEPAPAKEIRTDPKMFVEDMLVSKGHKRMQVRKLVEDPRVQISTGIIVSNLFHTAPSPSTKNPKVMEVNPKYIPLGIEFIEEHQDAFDLAWDKYKVSPELITAILIIETNLGKYPMKHNVFKVYASLTTALDAEYLAELLKPKGEKYALTDAVVASARKKGNWGLGELSALIQLSDKLGIDPIGINGSFAGALGPAQFIPTSFVHYGVDGNGDGKADPFDMDDCIASIANYFKLAGWKEDAKVETKRQAVYIYNHHQVYVNTVMMLYDKLIQAGEELDEPEEDETAAPAEAQPPASSSGTKDGAAGGSTPDQAKPAPGKDAAPPKVEGGQKGAQ